MKNLALIGAGYWGKNLARNFNILGALHTLCDASEKTLASYGKDYGEIQKTTDLDSVLKDPAVTRVAIAAPAALHYDLVKRCLDAGKDVFVEKPICLDIIQGRELISLAKAKGLILMVGHLLQYHPCIRAIQEMLAKGELGKLQYITSNRLNLGKIRKEENALWSFAPHDISVILSLAQGQLPQSVICTGLASLTPKVADTTLTALDFGDFKAHVYVSWLNPFKEQKLTVVGSHGMIVFDDTKTWNEKLVIYRNHLIWNEGSIPTPNKSSGEFIIVPESEPLREECSHFIDCCERRIPARTDGEEGLRALRVLDAAQQSLDGNGKAINTADFSDSAFQASDFFYHPSAIVDDGAQIGEGSRVWHFAHVCAGAKIGKSVSLGQNVFVGNKVTIGNRCKIQNNVSIYDNVTLEEGVFCGPSMVFTNVYNPRSLIERKSQYRNTLVKKGATLGANCTIVCGITIGEYAFVGAGAVVNKDVMSYALMVGVPAKQIGWISQYGEQIPLPIKGEGAYTCPHTGQRYELHGGTLSASSSQI